MRFNIFYRNEEGFKRREIIFLLLAFFVFILETGKICLFNKLMFCYDTIGYYGVMHHFYNSMMHGVFPYWDIYDYCGQPFYYNLGIARVMELPSVILIFINRIFNWSLLNLYNWDVAIKIFLYSAGVYFFQREMNKFTLSNCVGFFVFLFSSFTLTSFRQPGFLTSFAWTGWAAFFLIRLRKEFNLYNMVGAALFMGLLVTSYQVGYSFTFFEIFIATLLINDRKWLLGIFKDKKKVILLVIGLCIILLLSLQAAAVFMEKDRSAPVMRQGLFNYRDAGYDRGKGGAPASKWDYLELIFSPLVNMKGMPVPPLYISEAVLYIGIVPFVLALLALVFSRDKFKINFILMLLTLIFLSLNGRTLLGYVDAALFPFLRYARNMETFQPFFIFSLTYFVGQGMDLFLGWCKRYKT